MLKLLFTLSLLTFPKISLGAQELKIFSMNLHCGLGDWRSRMDQVVQEIVISNPDVIGLQEVCFNAGMNMTEYILESLNRQGYQVKIWKNIRTHRSFLKYQEELLIISKHEATDSDAQLLPSMKFFENGFVALEIKNVWFVTTHLHFALPYIRSWQYQLLSQLFGSKNAVVFGDMNSNPNNGETSVFLQQEWTHFYQGPTYPSHKPSKIFDGYWLSPSFSKQVSSGEMKRLFLDVENQPSDHLGVELSLILTDAQ